MLANYWGIRNNIIVPNVSWGMLDYEADLLIMNKTGYVTEIEIKRSWSDFLADFKKDEVAHKSEIINNVLTFSQTLYENVPELFKPKRRLI